MPRPMKVLHIKLLVLKYMLFLTVDLGHVISDRGFGYVQLIHFYVMIPASNRFCSIFMRAGLLVIEILYVA